MVQGRFLKTPSELISSKASTDNWVTELWWRIKDATEGSINAHLWKGLQNIPCWNKPSSCAWSPIKESSRGERKSLLIIGFEDLPFLNAGPSQFFRVSNKQTNKMVTKWTCWIHTGICICCSRWENRMEVPVLRQVWQDLIFPSSLGKQSYITGMPSPAVGFFLLPKQMFLLMFSAMGMWMTQMISLGIAWACMGKQEGRILQKSRSLSSLFASPPWNCAMEKELKAWASQKVFHCEGRSKNPQ